MKRTECYEFTVVLDQVDDQTPGLEDQLFEAGCDDALINFRGGTVYLDFCREATSFEEAVISAIQAVESIPAMPQVMSILPDDLVTETDIAKRLGKSRQTVSLWVKRERRQTHPFPNPVSKLSDRSPMWRWFDVVEWLYQNHVVRDKKLVDSAKFIEHINVVLGERDPEIQAYRHHLLDRLKRGRSLGRRGQR